MPRADFRTERSEQKPHQIAALRATPHAKCRERRSRSKRAHARRWLATRSDCALVRIILLWIARGYLSAFVRLGGSWMLG